MKYLWLKYCMYIVCCLHFIYVQNLCVYSCDMFAELLGSPDLFMMQVEMDAYTLAKKVRASTYVHIYCVCVVICIAVVVSKTSPTLGW